jgi:hypothetical protein
MLEKRDSVLAFAAREKLGLLVSERLVGSTIVYMFERGTVTETLPPGARTA